MRKEIHVTGMRCEACERSLSVALARLDGVRDVKADHETQRVKVRYDPIQVSDDRLREVIEQAGFAVR